MFNIWVFTVLVYISLFTYAFYHFKWWGIDDLKDTIIWFIFSGLPIGLNVALNKLERGFWKNLILDNLKLMVLLEFIINSFTFSLAAEFFFIIPFITIITMLNAYSKHKKEYKPVEKLTNLILTFFGFFILSYSLYRAIVDVQSIENMNTLKSISFPLIFSIISVPYMYVLKLYVEYENNVIIRIYNKESPRKSDKSKTSQTRAVQIIPVTKTLKVSASTDETETTFQFPDSKKEELVEYMTDHYGAREVKVIFIPSSNASSNGLLAVDYYTDTTPTKIALNDNIANIVMLSESLAEESGISNPNVSVCAMSMDGIPLGIGNYYSSTGKAIIDAHICP